MNQDIPGFISTGIICFPTLSFVSVVLPPYLSLPSRIHLQAGENQCFTSSSFHSYPIHSSLLLSPTPLLSLCTKISTSSSWIFSILPSETHFRQNLLRTSSFPYGCFFSPVYRPTILTMTGSKWRPRTRTRSRTTSKSIWRTVGPSGGPRQITVLQE